ncbi:LOW QUALITY PROTEIN: membrane-bound alkaline phosphatase-like [Leguminivora glycinivorella]|uniref:LOW QUALITY PROTEIN: membrane-bound alkaline phosphatase-like n=1 Tax=Leguminivora glycinivorella TaxID=1035111 RepID=UPI00200F9D6A|nr:LOW QUALITY PROTEIN: membrane-bound alkaline phosphatase-like [Leguminivora glycinivorella]
MRPSLLTLSVSLALLAMARGDRYHPARRAPATAAPASARAATPDEAERSAAYWYSEAFAAIDERLVEPTYDEVARNVVMFLGDGLSVPTLAAARALRGQRAGRPGEEERLSYEHFPVTGLAKTYCVDKQIPDSACTATAYLCGVKNNYGTLGVTAAVPRHDCAASADPATHLDSIAAWALADGRSAGIVTTTRITHASPAGAYANSANRGWESDSDVRADGQDPARCPDIADQLVNSHPGNKFQVILGGGRRAFRPNTTFDEESQPGRRWDGRDLIEEWRVQRDEAGQSNAYVWNRAGLLGAINSPPDYLLGLFESGHMQYAAEARQAGNDEPTLAEMTEAAIRVLSKNPRGFFLFVESGRIDHAHHDNMPHLALDETLALAAAVTRADELLPRASSLLVLTADHSHVMAYNGYSRRGNDILGVSDDLGDDDVPYMTLSYTNGPGYRPHVDGRRADVTSDNTFPAVAWKSHAEVPLESETHGGEDVAVFARGPAQALFTGLYEQSQLPHLMAHAACLGPAAARRALCSGAELAAPAAALLFALLAALFHMH